MPEIIEKSKSFLRRHPITDIISQITYNMNFEIIKMSEHKDMRNIECRMPNFKLRNLLFAIRYSISEVGWGLPHHYSTSLYHLVFFGLFSVLCLFSGCANSLHEIGQRPPTPDANRAELMEITEDVLTRMHFEIDKYDTEAGYLNTRPLEGAQFFELWRSDNIGAQNFALGNLHSIRRTVEIRFSENFATTQAFAETNIDCVVHIQRLSMPEQEVTSSARAYAMFSRSSPGLQTLVLNPEQQKDMAWIDLGQDEKLEREIFKRISSTLGVRGSYSVTRTSSEARATSGEK